MIPTWEAVLPGAVEAAARAAEVAAEMEALATDALADAGARLGYPDVAKAVRLSAGGLLQLSAAQRRLLLHRWLEVRASVVASRATVLALEALLAVPGAGECTLAGDWHARKEYDAVWLERGARIPAAVPAPVPLPVPGEADWAGVRIRAEQAECFCAPDPTSEAYVDARALQGPLLVRGPCAGDRLRPLGAPGTRKLQDVLVDLRVPAADRALVPVVLSGDRVVWVCGLVVAEEGRIRADTSAIVRLSASPSAGGLAPPATD